jgi:hypothetical protein
MLMCLDEVLIFETLRSFPLAYLFQPDEVHSFQLDYKEHSNRIIPPEIPFCNLPFFPKWTSYFCTLLVRVTETV